MTYYAQMARSYAIETMFAVIASYLLLRAWPDGRWRWWLGYGAAVALTGLFNIFGLLIVAAHGVTLLLTDARGQTAPGRRAGRIPLRWLAACAAALIVLGPLLGLASRQQVQIAWLNRPTLNAMERLLTNLAGSRPLIVPFALLALGGLLAAWLADHWRPLNPAAIALPWLVVPPFVLVAVSFVKPVYYVRYIEFCLPALAILAGAGLTALIRLAAVTPLRRSRPGRWRLGPLTWAVWAWPGCRPCSPSRCSPRCWPGRSRRSGRPPPARTTCGWPPPSWPPTSSPATWCSTSRPPCTCSAPGTRRRSAGCATSR